MVVNISKFYTTDKDLCVEDKKKLLEWILRNDFVGCVETISVGCGEEDFGRFWNVYSPLFTKLVEHWKREGNAWVCPECRTLYRVSKDNTFLACRECGYEEKDDEAKKE